jgi:UDP-2,3-diacylglucosamine pyrophosphatase LpxH
VTRLTSIPEYRTIWISDLHLGTRGCKAEFLLDFLKYTEAETIYLVGDIIDGWRLRKSWYWPQTHNDVIQKVLRKVRKGTRVVYVPGNHDEWLRDFTQLQFGGVEVVEDAVHVTVDGRRLLVIHGDAFDAVVMNARWLALLGDGAYFADAVADEARRRGVDGVVCGHIHHAELREIGGILYCNTGDWVESCTALVEHFDGRLELIDWIGRWALDPLSERIALPPDLDEEAPALVDASS